MELNLNLLEGVDALLSNQRPVGDTTPVVRTTPTRGNVMIMSPAAELMGVGTGSRAVVLEMPSGFAGGQVPTDYPQAATHNNKVFAIHVGKTSEDGNRGNKCSKQGHGFQFSSANVWDNLGGEGDTVVEYKIGDKYVAIGIFNENGAYVARPVTAPDAAAVQYIVVDNDAETGFSQKGAGDALDSVTPFFLLEYLDTKTGQGRKKSSEGEDEVEEEVVEADATDFSDLADDSFSL